jgi:hypothetical protein
VPAGDTIVNDAGWYKRGGFQVFIRPIANREWGAKALPAIGESLWRDDQCLIFSW